MVTKFKSDPVCVFQIKPHWDKAAGTPDTEGDYG